MKPLRVILTLTGVVLVTFFWHCSAHQELGLWHLAPIIFSGGAVLFGALALLILWIQPQVAMLLLFGAKFTKIPGYFTVLVGPGTFFLTVALVLFIAANQGKPPRAP